MARHEPPGPKPGRGPAWRNLYWNARAGSIFVTKRLNGKTVERSLNTNDWAQARRVRDLVMKDLIKDLGGDPSGYVAPQTDGRSLSEHARDFFRESPKYQRFKPATKENYEREVGPKSPAMRFLGDLPPDEIHQQHLIEYRKSCLAAGRSEIFVKQSCQKLAALFDFMSGVGAFGYTPKEGPVEHNPVPAFFRWLRRQQGYSSTARGQAQTRIRPIRDRDRLAALWRFSGEAVDRWRDRAQGRDWAAAVGVPLMLDAGLRYGEVGGLQWENVHFGAGRDDPDRHLAVCHTLSVGQLVSTKGGETRRVPISRRLWLRLRERWQAAGRPQEGPVLVVRDWHGWRSRRFPELLQRADENHGVLWRKKHGALYTPKNLRQTFASWLVSLGVDIHRVKTLLGHSSVTITEQHYADFISEADWIRAPRLRQGDVITDLLATLSANNEDRREKAPRRR